MEHPAPSTVSKLLMTATLSGTAGVVAIMAVTMVEDLEAAGFTEAGGVGARTPSGEEEGVMAAAVDATVIDGFPQDHRQPKDV